MVYFEQISDRCPDFLFWGSWLAHRSAAGRMEDFLRGEAIMEVALVRDISKKRKVRLIWARKEDQTKGMDGVLLSSS